MQHQATAINYHEHQLVFPTTQHNRDTRKKLCAWSLDMTRHAARW
jgi:hypothetical protein